MKDPRGMIGQNPTGRPRRSSARKRRQEAWKVLREAAKAWRELHPAPTQVPSGYMDPRSFALWLERRAEEE